MDQDYLHDFLDFSDCQKKRPDHLVPGFGDPGSFLGYLGKLEKNMIRKSIHFVNSVCPIFTLLKQGKVCTLKNNTNLNSIFCLIKSSKIDFIFTFILPEYLGHEMTKEF